MGIPENVAASNAARVVMDLLLDEAINHKGDAAVRYYVTLLKWLLKMVPEEHVPKQNVQAPVVPMTADECSDFEMDRMEFGKHGGDFIGEVPLEYLEWLDSQHDFRQQLRRYLASKQVQRQMVVADDEEEVTDGTL